MARAPRRRAFTRFSTRSAPPLRFGFPVGPVRLCRRGKCADGKSAHTDELVPRPYAGKKNTCGRLQDSVSPALAYPTASDTCKSLGMCVRRVRFYACVCVCTCAVKGGGGGVQHGVECLGNLLMTTGAHNQLIRSTERERFGLGVSTVPSFA